MFDTNPGQKVKNVGFGELFEYQGGIYMLLDTAGGGISSETNVLAANVQTGSIRSLTNPTKVNTIEATLVLGFNEDDSINEGQFLTIDRSE